MIDKQVTLDDQNITKNNNSHLFKILWIQTILYCFIRALIATKWTTSIELLFTFLLLFIPFTYFSQKFNKRCLLFPIASILILFIFLFTWSIIHEFNLYYLFILFSSISFLMFLIFMIKNFYTTNYNLKKPIAKYINLTIIILCSLCVFLDVAYNYYNIVQHKVSFIMINPIITILINILKEKLNWVLVMIILLAYSGNMMYSKDDE